MFGNTPGNIIVLLVGAVTGALTIREVDMATIAVTKRESNSWGWAIFQLIGLTVLAYVITLVVYQLGSHLGIGI